MNTEQAEKMRNGKGFIAALDQSGGSTPKALAAYGVGPERYSNEAEMFDLVHASAPACARNSAASGRPDRSRPSRPHLL